MARRSLSPVINNQTNNAIKKIKESEDVEISEIKVISPEIKSWCRSVDDFSSQYGNEHSISYTMSNLEGASSVYSQYGDFTQAAVMRTYGKWWKKCPSAVIEFSRSRGSFVSQDFVELSFDCLVLPTSVEIFETYNPGAVVRILARDRLTSSSMRWHVLWEGLPQTPPPHTARIFNPQPIRKCPFYTNYIRIEFHHSHLPYYAELDAVRLSGLPPSNNSFPAANNLLPNHVNHLDGLRSSEVDPEFVLDDCSQILKPPRIYSMPDVNDIFSLDDSDGEDDGLGSSVDVVVATRTESVAMDDVTNFESEDGRMDSEEMFLGDCDGSEGCSCAFFRLPMEILKIIFDYLDLKSLHNLSSTCRFFYQHCNDETQFYELDLQPYWHLITDAILSTMSQKFNNFRKVDLSWCNNLTNSGLSNFLNETRPMLTCLRLNACPFVDGHSLEIISSRCPNLRELRLQSCQKANGSSFTCLSSLKELRILDLYRTLINTDSLLTIIRSCPHLEHLNIGSCTNNNDCNRVATELGRCCPKLKSVDFWRSRRFTFSGLSTLVSGCRRLEELDLGWCNQLKSSDGCFQEIAKNCPNLKKLFLTANRAVCNADIDLLSQNCRHLEQLDVLGTREITNTSIIRLLEKCHSLELLDLSFCEGIDYHTLEPVLLGFLGVDVKRSFQGSVQAEEYLDRPAQFQ